MEVQQPALASKKCMYSMCCLFVFAADWQRDAVGMPFYKLSDEIVEEVRDGVDWLLSSLSDGGVEVTSRSVEEEDEDAEADRVLDVIVGCDGVASLGEGGVSPSRLTSSSVPSKEAGFAQVSAVPSAGASVS